MCVCKQCFLDVEKIVKFDEALPSQLVSLMEKKHDVFRSIHVSSMITCILLFTVPWYKKRLVTRPDPLATSENKNGGSKGQLRQMILDRRDTSALTAVYLTLYLARTTKVARPAVLHDDVISTDFHV